MSIPLAPVYDALKINPGDAYQISDLYQAQQRIYQLQTFFSRLIGTFFGRILFLYSSNPKTARKSIQTTTTRWWHEF